jgi:hypothetical protein
LHLSQRHFSIGRLLGSKDAEAQQATKAAAAAAEVAKLTDLTGLQHLHEPSLLHALHQRASSAPFPVCNNSGPIYDIT